MKEFPHYYSADAAAVVDADNVILTSTGIPALSSAAPAQFGGPGDRWSPETLIVGAIADCFILTFRAVAARPRCPGLRSDARSQARSIASSASRSSRPLSCTRSYVCLKGRTALWRDVPRRRPSAGASSLTR